MKNIVIILCALLWTGIASGEGNDSSRQPRRSGLEGVSFHNFGYSIQKVTLNGKHILDSTPTLTGVGLTTGHSFYAHRKPIGGMIRLGFDVVWFDFDYAMWKERISKRKKWVNKFDIGMGLGPAIHLFPVDDLGIHAYFRFDPTVSVLAHNCAGDEEGKFELMAGFATYFSTGAIVSWRVFSIGGEFRFGGGKYRAIRIPDVTVSRDEIDLNLDDALNRQRQKMVGGRIYFGLRF